jgi:hypothetical protein
VFATPSGVALWLKVALDPLPQLPAGVNGTGLVTLRIEHVGGPGGSELYAPDSPMEQGAAGGVYLNRSATGGWSGVRTVYLRAGSQKQAVGTVRGEVVLSLPTGVRWAELTAGDIGQEREAADGIGVTQLHLRGTGVALQLHGTDLSMHLAGIAGIMTDGALSAPESMTPTYSGDQVHIEADFTDPPRGVRVLLAHGRRQSRHPFSLAPGQTLNFPLR